jgi:putative oxygen-independent coproporphyrinogen III oxidase
VKLKSLGRIHNDQDARSAIELALKAGFQSVNIDLMYGLPKQSLDEALEDLNIALSFPIRHVSWYELTLEPNTLFYEKPPPLPAEISLIEIETEGIAKLLKAGFERYEISAFTKGVPARHNLNYWSFGDYLGIGAGAHGKLTDSHRQTIIRYAKQRHPKAYMNTEIPFIQEEKILSESDIVLEFMLNALRLREGFLIQAFEERTFQSLATIEATLERLVKKGLLLQDEARIRTTSQGFSFLNEILAEF